MQSPPEPAALEKDVDSRSDERLVLLDEVNFKWLLAGLGLWIDMARFRTEPAYAAHFLALAQASESHALQNCASALKNQIPTSCD
jgi:hypothetical protein